MRSQSNSPSVGTCANCGQSKYPHRVCESCGHYGGKAVIEVAADNLDE
jgi:large subunit ribosomal protein L32